MPPKKKSKTRDASSPAAGDAPTPTAATPNAAKEAPPAEPVISDGWTDEQETTLFKAISVYNMKPAGMHKHFRMIAIAELMKNHGVADKHTNIPGIWAKLRTLYNLDGLDEREDISEDGLESDHWAEFALPHDEFGQLMMSRRFNTEGSRSASPTTTLPPHSDGQGIGGKRTERTLSPSGTSSLALTESGIDTDDEQSATPSSLPTKRGRGRPPGSTKAKSTGPRGRPPKIPGRGRGRPRKDQQSTREPKPSVEDEDDEEEESDDDEEDSEEEEDDDETEDELDDTEEDDESVRTSRASRASRGSPERVKRGRGRPPGTSNRGRGREKRGDVRRSKRNK